MTSSVSVPAAMLRRMIGAVLPHACDDDDLPALFGVRFEVSGGTLVLSATDRYTLGVARYRIPGADVSAPASPSVLLSRRDAKMLRAILREHDERLVAAITLAERSLTAECGAFRAQWTAGEHTEEGADWRSILRRALAGKEVPLGDRHGVDAEKTGRLLPSGSDELAEPMRARIMLPLGREGEDPGPMTSPLVLFARGDWFLGAVMPVRLGGMSSGVPWDDWAAVLAPPESPEAAA